MGYGDETDGFSTTVLVETRTGPTRDCGDARWSACCRCWPWRRAPSWVAARIGKTSPPMTLARRAPARSCGTGFERRDRTATTALSLLDAERLARVLAPNVDEASSSARTASGRCRRRIARPHDRRRRAVAGTIIRAAEVAPRCSAGNSNWRASVWYRSRAARRRAAHLRRVLREGTGLGPTPIDQRLVALFRPGTDGRRPSGKPPHVNAPCGTAHPTFSEYSTATPARDSGRSPDGWTAIVAQHPETPRTRYGR